MNRTFITHFIRRQLSLDGLWQLTPTFQSDWQSRPVLVPGCWETLPGLENYRGTALYERRFSASGNVRICFEGVGHTASVFVDGQAAACHYNAYTPFSVLLRHLPAGDHIITVEADNRYSPDSTLHIPNDYESYGGISRPVVLEWLPDVYLESVHLTPSFRDDGWHLNIQAKVQNIGDGPHTVSVSSQINGQCIFLGTADLEAGESAVLEAEEQIDGIEPYEPESPALYTVNTLLTCDGEEDPCDDLIERTGFREVKVKDGQILWNGKPMRIKGVNRHEAHPQFGNALPLEAMAYDLQLIQDVGANAVRTSHYPNDQRFLDLCDEMGIFVWEESHARGLSEEQMRNPNFQPQSLDGIHEMVDAHYNHPSIFIWGILNECASETTFGRECYEEQFRLLRLLDNSRPVSFASCKADKDLCLDLVDVVSYNIYPKWYHDTPAGEYLDWLYQWVQDASWGKGKPFLITEVGAGAIYGFRSPAKPKWSEERQAVILKEQLRAILNREGITGVFLWQFCDIRVSEEWFRSRPRSCNNKGITDEYRRPKLAYETVREIFRTFNTWQ